MSASDYFIKLKLDFSEIDIDTVDMKFGHAYTNPNDHGSQIFKVFHTEDEFQDYIKSKLPESFRPWIRRARIVIMESPGIPPHRDHNKETDIRAAINFYSQTGGARTTFWSAEGEIKVAPHPFHPYERTADLVMNDNLVEECSAVFEKDTCYLLNVYEVHSLDIDEGETRKIIQLTFNSDITYNMLVDKLTELNLIEKTQ